MVIEDPHGEGRPRDDGRSESPNERADRNWNELLQELRVVQTSTQILGGFLLAVAFQPRFTELDDYQLRLYLILVGLAGVATILGLTPVTMHREYFRQGKKSGIVRTGSRLLELTIIVVAALAVGVTSLIFDFTVDRTAGLIALGAGFVVVLLLFTLVPRLGIRRVERAEE